MLVVRSVLTAVLLLVTACTAVLSRRPADPGSADPAMAPVRLR